MHVEDDGFFASYMADTPLQFHQLGAAAVPVSLCHLYRIIL